MTMAEINVSAVSDDNNSAIVLIDLMILILQFSSCIT